jgi:DNA-binding PadR family transcriptional regulator
MPADNLQFAVLGLVAARPEGVHGYQLKSDVEALFDDFWQVNYGRLYRILDLLDRSGDLSLMEEIQRGRPNRKVYRITEKGSQTLDDWLLQPVSDDPRPLRDELSLKLLFLEKSNIDALNAQIKQQRSIYLKKLARLVRRRKRLQKAGFRMEVASLVIDAAEMRVHADLAWLDHVERRILRTF